jgi:hypothetical protein
MRIILSTLIVFGLLFSPAAYADEASHRAAAGELLKLMKTDQMMKPLFEQMRSLMDQQFEAMDLPEDARPALKKYTDKLLKALQEQLGWDKIKDDYISIYAETFSEEELRAISAFYRTPAGQTYIRKMPLLMKKSVALSQRKMPEILNRMKQITDEMVREMKDEVARKAAKKSGGTPSKGI